MSSFINTVDVIGDDALTDSIIDRSVAEYTDNNITTVGYNAFYGCSLLRRVVLPKVDTLYSSAFEKCTSLEVADFTALSSIGSMSVFLGCNALTALILRNTSKFVGMGFNNILNGTPIQSGTGYIYVPSALVDSYKTATHWSTFATQFRALEDYTVDGTTTGALDPGKI